MVMDSAGTCAGSDTVHNRAVRATAPTAARSQARPAHARQQAASSTELSPTARCRCRFILYTPPGFWNRVPGRGCGEAVGSGGSVPVSQRREGAVRRVRGTAAGNKTRVPVRQSPASGHLRPGGFLCAVLYRLCAARAYVTVCSGPAPQLCPAPPVPRPCPCPDTALRVLPRMMSIDDRGCKSCKSVSRPKKFFQLAPVPPF